MIGVFGTLSSGKTVFSIYLLLTLKDKGYKVITNSTINSAYLGTTYLTMDEIIDKGKNDTQFFYNSVLFLDEFHLLVESRRSNASINVDFTQNILIQLGKLDCILIYTSQLLSQIDIRIREMTKYFYSCKKVNAIGEPILSEKRIIEEKIYIEILRLIRFSETDIQEDLFIFDPEPYFKMYNTREIITIDREKYLKK